MTLADLTPDVGLAISAFVTVLVIMDPFGNVPIFLALTRDADAAERNRAARQAVLVAGGVIIAFALGGQQLLALLGISLEALQVAGGLLLALIALDLLNPAEGGPTSAAGTNVALVPLGTPLLAGPGAIAATMLAIGQADRLGGVLSVVVALVAVLGVVYLGMRFADVLRRVLKDNGIQLITRVLGVLLAAIAVQLVAVAVQAWIRHGVV